MSEVLGPNCLVNFSMEDTSVDEGGAHAEGYISCDANCSLRYLRTITGDVDAGISGVDIKAAAEAKVLRRARGQMVECAVWKADPANTGQDIPNDRLPQILQRRS